MQQLFEIEAIMKSVLCTLPVEVTGFWTAEAHSFWPSLNGYQEMSLEVTLAGMRMTTWPLSANCSTCM